MTDIISDDDRALLRVMKLASSTNEDTCSPQERKSGLQLLNSLLHHRAALTNQIANTIDSDDDSELSLLETKRNHLSTEIRTLRLAIAPHKRLPPEILAKIFVSTLEREREVIAYPIYTEQIPWVLSRVCSFWRKVAKAEPLLWSSVRITLPGRKQPNLALDQAVSFLQEIFPRTGSLHLTLVIVRTITGVLKKLVQPYLSRIEQLYIRFREAVFSGINRLTPSSFKNVKDLSLFLAPPIRHDATWDSLNELEIFHHMKNLQNLTFNSPFFISDLNVAQTLGLPFSQLKSLDLSHLFTAWDEDVIPFLRLCTSVEHYVHPVHVPLVNAPDAHLLPKLRSLTASHVLPPLVPELNWTRLVDFSLEAEIFDENHFTTILNALATCVNLETLKPQLRYEERGDGPAKRIITMPKVHTLNVSSPEDWFLDHLKLPELVKINVGQRYVGDNIPGEFFLDLVTRSKCSLRSLHFQWDKLLQYFSTTIDDLFLQLLVTSSRLKELYIRRIKFNETVWRDIADGILLPQLRVLEINVATPTSFVEAMERQVSRRGELMVASGYYDGELSEAEQGLGDRLLELNLLVCSDYRLVKHQQTYSHDEHMQMIDSLFG